MDDVVSDLPLHSCDVDHFVAYDAIVVVVAAVHLVPLDHSFAFEPWVEPIEAAYDLVVAYYVHQAACQHPFAVVAVEQAVVEDAAEAEEPVAAAVGLVVQLEVLVDKDYAVNVMVRDFATVDPSSDLEEAGAWACFVVMAKPS